MTLSRSERYEEYLRGYRPGPTVRANAAPLLSGYAWSRPGEGAASRTPTTITFAFPEADLYGYSGDLQEFTDSESEFPEEDRRLAREILREIEAVTNVRFVELASASAVQAQLLFRYSNHVTRLNFAGYGFYPSEHHVGGDIWLATSMRESRWDSYRGHLILHETLHAIGLKHPFAGDAVLPLEQNVIANTVMSYSPLPGASGGSLSAWPATPMVLDILALQQLYGPGVAGTGDTVYDLATPDFQTGYQAIWDAGGFDVLDAKGIPRGVVLDLREGHASDVGAGVRAYDAATGVSVFYTDTLTLAYGSLIEAAWGSRHDDLIVGNALPNLLRGREGADILAGGEGDDTLEGGAGDDALDGGPGRDTAQWLGPRERYAVTATAAGWVVQDRAQEDGTDTVVGVERLVFANGGLAIDLDGQAGMVARIMGVVLGPRSLADAVAVADYLRAADEAGVAAAARKALAAANEASLADFGFVSLLFSNVVGVRPDPQQGSVFVDLLHDSGMDRAAFVLWAADTGEAAAAIGLVGLQVSGLPFAATGDA